MCESHVTNAEAVRCGQKGIRAHDKSAAGV